MILSIYQHLQHILDLKKNKDMKLNQLIKIVKPTLIELGFTYFPHKTDWAGGVFCKKEPKDMFLTIGITMDRFYDCSFTFDLYYSTTTNIGSAYGDIPFGCYTRPDWLLTNKNRHELKLPDEPECFWWDSLDEDNLLLIKKVLIISEEKLLGNTTLLEKVKKSVDTKKLLNRAFDIIKKVRDINGNEKIEYCFVPNKTTNDIPIKWFQATEIVCNEYYKGNFNKHCINSAVCDAYRIYSLSEQYNGK